MARPLVVVESKAKAATLARLLGGGHALRTLPRVIEALPRTGLGVDTERGFAPDLRVPPSCRRPLAELRAAAREADLVWLAFDPDAEGERFAQRVALELAAAGAGRVRRAVCRELTRPAVTAALDAAGDVNARRADAQQARALVDRLIGRGLLPLLTGPSRAPGAGRALLAALGLLRERERERAGAAAGWPPAASTAKGPARRGSPPPIVTATLLLEASRSFDWRPQRTLAVAERLWDGSALGGECGLISFPRGESPIRPTDPARRPAALAGLLAPDERALYGLVFERFEAWEPDAGSSARTAAARAAAAAPGGESRSAAPSGVAERVPAAPLFTEVALLNELCRLRIARFSADTNLASLADARGLVRRDKNRLQLTRQGGALADWLLLHAPQLAAPREAAALAARLDAIETGGETPFSVLASFWRGLRPALARARAERPSITSSGSSIATFATPHRAAGQGGSSPSLDAGAKGHGRRPARPVGVSCPRCDSGQLVEREAHDKRFYGCSRYPACRFTCSDRPLAESCPRCGHAYLLVRETRHGPVSRCGSEGCRYRRPAGGPRPASAR